MHHWQVGCQQAMVPRSIGEAACLAASSKSGSQQEAEIDKLEEL
jgi:hypothetical protein